MGIGRREAEAALAIFGRLDDEAGQARALDVLAVVGLCNGSHRAAVGAGPGGDRSLPRSWGTA